MLHYEGITRLSSWSLNEWSHKRISSGCNPNEWQSHFINRGKAAGKGDRRKFQRKSETPIKRCSSTSNRIRWKWFDKKCFKRDEILKRIDLFFISFFVTIWNIGLRVWSPFTLLEARRSPIWRRRISIIRVKCSRSNFFEKQWISSGNPKVQVLRRLNW